MKLSLIQSSRASDDTESLLEKHTLAEVLVLAAMRIAPFVAEDQDGPASCSAITSRVAA